MKTKTKVFLVSGALLFTATGFLLGGGFGFSAGKSIQLKHDIKAVKLYLESHQEAVIFINPRDQAIALVQNGVCLPFPSPEQVPTLHHRVFVAESWNPCSRKTIAPYIQSVKPLRALKASK